MRTLNRAARAHLLAELTRLDPARREEMTLASIYPHTIVVTEAELRRREMTHGRR